ncbi:MAG: hypothetical protein M1812_005819 [Candelaria pacifica]|nr:MAG: hypothetical protein M1812_005819 [Candelaria pacifica]
MAGKRYKLSLKARQRILRERWPGLAPRPVRSRDWKKKNKIIEGCGPSPLRYDWFSYYEQRATYNEMLEDARKEYWVANKCHIGVADEGSRQRYQERKRKAHAKVAALEVEKVKKMMEWIPKGDRFIFKDVLTPVVVKPYLNIFPRRAEKNWIEKLIDEEEELFAEGVQIGNAEADMMIVEEIEEGDEIVTVENPPFSTGMEIRELREIATDFWQIPPEVSEHEYHFLVRDHHQGMDEYPRF